ncbi:hypothetical protein [Streptomyces sp. NPDC005209]|uniref:hypothetical protein n=1 Tax=Streptomyces sp. NPDC005209 TaxID=3156715 RepID=UPI0033ACD6E0
MRDAYGAKRSWAVPAAAVSAVLGLAVGAALIRGARSFERLAVGHSDTWLAAIALTASAAIGVAAWLATGAEYSAVGWALGIVLAVHSLAGTLAAETRILHDRGREVTAVVQREHVHRNYTDLGEETDPTYTYDMAPPPGVPHRTLDAGTTRLTVGARVLVTVDPQDRAAPRLGHRPESSRLSDRILSVCELLVLLLLAGLSAGLGHVLGRSAPHRRAAALARRRGPGPPEDTAHYAGS